MLKSPFGSGVALHDIRAEEASAAQLFEEERALIATSRNASRRAEFAAGRIAARRALAELGQTPDLPILRDDRSRPLWPAGFIGSITHKAGRAVAVAARASHYRGIGVDLERIAPLSVDIGVRIASVAEQAWIQADTAQTELRTLLLFSAKEALYKALDPLLNVTLQFKDASLAPGDAEGTLRVSLSDSVRGLLGSMTSVQCRYQVEREFLLTICTLN